MNIHESCLSMTHDDHSPNSSIINDYIGHQLVVVGGTPPEILIFLGRSGALGASDLDGGPPGDHFPLLFMFWDALEPKLWPKNNFDTFSQKFFQGFFYITSLFGAPQALGTSPLDSS